VLQSKGNCLVIGFRGVSRLGLILAMVAGVSVGSAEAQVLAMPASVATSSDDSLDAIDFDLPLDDGMVVDQDAAPTWQWLPDGLMYRSYLASGREPRFASQWVREQEQGWLWDITLGGRVGLWRYGTEDPLLPQGWQIDLEGAAFPRLALEQERDLVSVDFRCGVPITFRRGRWEGKFGYYHLSSHLGDEYELTHPWIHRINYSREALVLGVAYYPWPDLRLYGETGWAFYSDGGSEPWEFQFGADYSPWYPTGARGAPFFAVNGRLRQEIDYGGNFTLQTGWQWRGRTGHLLRTGLQYFNGQSDQYQFFREHEQQVGVGLWYDY
jgi:hypothetical protein